MSMTTIKYDDIKQEIDYEKYLPLDMIMILENLREEQNKPELFYAVHNVREKILQYDQTCNEMRKKMLINVNIVPFEQNNISVSIEKSYAIENETIDPREDNYVYFVNLYNDVEYCRRFNVNFVKNIKQMSKKLKLKNAGKFKDRENDCIISHPEYDILPISYQNTNRYIKALVDLINYPVPENLIFIKSILIHICFEAIHPFTDGNGRIGRFLLNNNINVYLKNNIYLDVEIYKNRDTYYKNLLLFNTNKEQVAVIIWFLEIITKTINNNIQICEDVLIKNEKLKIYFKELELFNDVVNSTLANIFAYTFGVSKDTIFACLSQIYKDNRSKQKVFDSLLEQKIIYESKGYYFLKDDLL